jgi:GTP pyrophosphokinase
MINDVRLVLILLAEQLVLMRAAIDFSEEVQQRLATSTMTYHAALANRLGVWQIKWELEDLSFRFLQADQYKKVAKKLAEKRNDREQFIHSCSKHLTQKLAENNIEADIAGRPKHIFSIYKKMQQKNLEFEGLFDIRAIRVLVNSVADCYATLGIVHATWSHIPKEFDDYIAQPKGNNYQSLHTVVVVDGKTLEVQIRTHQMHEHAELGVAAHWRYKDGSKQDLSYDNKVNWMRQLLSEHAGSDDLLAAFQSDTQEERVYVFTPTGDVVDLPFGSTPVDFAYQVHTEVGHRCRGAKVNGSIVPLTRALNTGDQIEILTAKIAKPSRDWLHEQSGYLRSVRARAKVRHWFRENDFDKNLQIGKEMLEAELNKFALQNTDLNQLLDSFNLQHIDKLYAMIATGDITVNQVLRRADLQLNPAKKFNQKPLPKKAQNSKYSGGLIVEGVDSLKTTLASCCNPVQGDSIGGFITRTRGISVHQASCDNYLHMISEQPNRLVNVKWNDDDTEDTVTALKIVANNRKHVIKDISALLAHLKVEIMALHAEPDNEAGLVNINISIQIRDFDHLSEVMSRLSSLQHINYIQRNLS